MKKLLFKFKSVRLFYLITLFQILPYSLFSQVVIGGRLIEIDNRLPDIFSYKSEELRALMKTNRSLLKMSDSEIESVIKIVDERKGQYFELNKKATESIPRDATGRPTGKANSELLIKRKIIRDEVSESVCILLGEKRNRQFHRLLIDEKERRTMNALKKAGKNK
jgi:hypothetical protein